MCTLGVYMFRLFSILLQRLSGKIQTSLGSNMSSKAKLVKLLVNILEQKCAENSDVSYLPARHLDKAAFYSVEEHPLTLDEYIEFIVSNLSMTSESTYVVALIYMDRVTLHDPSLQVTKYNVHRLFSGCLLLAIKLLEEVFEMSSTFYANVTGLEDAKEVNFLELVLLKIMKFRLAVSYDCHELYHNLFGFRKIYSWRSKKESLKETVKMN